MRGLLFSSLALCVFFMEKLRVVSKAGRIRLIRLIGLIGLIGLIKT